jgi:hypothetical protein
MQSVRLVRFPSNDGGTMSEQEMQELQNRVVESIQDYFDNYDWDGKFIEHFGQ